MGNFPKSILLESSKKREEWFEKEIKINHKMLEGIVHDLVERIKSPSGNNLIMIVGPTGVGKTTMQQLVVKEILQWSKSNKEMEGRIPITGIELPAPELGKFNWKDYYKRSLEALNEPLIDFKVDFEKYLIGNETKRKNISPYDSKTSPELRRSLEKAFYYRQPLAFLVDEAQHFSNIVSSNAIKIQLDIIKSLSNISNVLHVLIGHYDLVPFINLSAQLSRRTVDIHFPRYNINKKEELQDFVNIIANFQKTLPLEKEPDLITHYEFLYERSLGCVGILKDWLLRCLVGALNSGEETISKKHLQKYSLSIQKIAVMLDEILEGEKLFESNGNKVLNVRLRMGLNTSEKKSAKPGKNTINTGKGERGVSGVGHRNPERDEVGRGRNNDESF